MRWLFWNNYVSRDDEDAALRMDVNPAKLGLRIFANTVTGAVSVVRDQPDVIRASIVDLDAVRDVLQIRAVAHSVAGITTLGDYTGLNAMYEEALTKRVPIGYRNVSNDGVSPPRKPRA